MEIQLCSIRKKICNTSYGIRIIINNVIYRVLQLYTIQV